MEQEKVFTVSPPEATEQGWTAHVCLNAGHPVFKGHFPGQPVLPGVLMLKITVDCCRLITGRELQLQQVIQAKYLNFISPLTHPEFECRLSLTELETGWKVSATLLHSELTFSKILLICAIH